MIRASTPFGTNAISQEASLSSLVRVQSVAGAGSKRKGTYIALRATKISSPGYFDPNGLRSKSAYTWSTTNPTR